jgi:hypothetical protein
MIYHMTQWVLVQDTLTQREPGAEVGRLLEVKAASEGSFKSVFSRELRRDKYEGIWGEHEA